MTVCEDPSAKMFGRGEVGVDAEGDGEGPPTKLYGKCEVGVDTVRLNGRLVRLNTV
jgi:hypothetical protein